MCFTRHFPLVNKGPVPWHPCQQRGHSGYSTSLPALGVVFFSLTILVVCSGINTDCFHDCNTNDHSLHPRRQLPARLQPFPVRGQCRADCADLVYSSGGRPQGWPNAQHPGYSMTLDPQLYFYTIPPTDKPQLQILLQGSPATFSLTSSLSLVPLSPKTTALSAPSCSASSSGSARAPTSCPDGRCW